MFWHWRTQCIHGDTRIIENISPTERPYLLSSLFFSGESGAGKTVSAKHIMNFIAKASGKGSEKVEVWQTEYRGYIGAIEIA